MPVPRPRSSAPLFTFGARALGWAGGSALAIAGALTATASERMDPCYAGTAGDLCYCEAFHEGPLKQPANALSGLGLVAIAIAILARPSGEARGGNVFARERAYRLAYGLVVLYLGVGTVAFHASYTYVAGVLDGSGMYAWVTAVITLNLVRLAGLSRARAGALWLAANALALGLRVSVTNQGAAVSATTILFGALAALAVSTTAALPLARREVPCAVAHGWLGVCLTAFGGGVAVWSMSGSAGPLCDPHASLQGHAAWHLAGALAVAAHYAYLCRARDAAPQRSASAAASRTSEAISSGLIAS